MATKVFETEKLEVDGGTIIEMKPLKIGKLRDFMNAIKGLEEAKNDQDKQFDVLTSCAVICLSQWDKELASEEWAEENLTLENYYEMIRVASGLDLTLTAGNE